MRYEWDDAKAERNERKHGITFEVAILVFDDPNCALFVERVQDGEERWHAIGSVMGAVILTVVHTYYAEATGETIRIISARNATAQERKLYAQNLG
jgi:uncharacterized DUF497 family protein